MSIRRCNARHSPSMWMMKLSSLSVILSVETVLIALPANCLSLITLFIQCHKYIECQFHISVDYKLQKQKKKKHKILSIICNYFPNALITLVKRSIWKPSVVRRCWREHSSSRMFHICAKQCRQWKNKESEFGLSSLFLFSDIFFSNPSFSIECVDRLVLLHM